MANDTSLNGIGDLTLEAGESNLLLRHSTLLSKDSAVTSHKDLQSLIADIDHIVAKIGSRLPFSKSSDGAQERQILERIRSYITSQQQKSPPALPTQQSAIEQIVQGVSHEIEALRADLKEPLQTELAGLRQQQESLIREIEQLEGRRRQLQDTLAQQEAAQTQKISELINNSTESLTQQLTQVLVNLEAQLLSGKSPTAAKSTTISEILPPQERLEQFRQLQRESDHMLTTLDANQRAIFETLQRNLYSYEESLSQGLETMHRLSLQGEMLFTALVNRLAQQLGRETSTRLQSSTPLSEVVLHSPQTTSQPSPPNQLLGEGWTETEPTSYPVADVSSVVSLNLTPQLNPLSEQQGLLQPPFSVNTAGIGNVTGTLHTSAEAALNESFGETTESQDWEAIEGLDTEPFKESDRIDTFIQLDVDTLKSLPEPEDLYTTNIEESQEFDFLEDLDNETSIEAPPSSAEPINTSESNRLAESEAVTEQQLNTQSYRQDIEDLYQSLFGTDLSFDAVKADELSVPGEAAAPTSEPPTGVTDVQPPRENQPTCSDSTPLVLVEENLFEGLVDPATEPAEAESSIQTEGHLPMSWENLLFEDAVARTSQETDVAEGQVSEAISPPTHAETSDNVDTIATLTDLLDEMGLSYSLLETATSVTPMPREEEWSGEEIPEIDPHLDRVDERYIPASPDEDLLAQDDEFTSYADREIQLNRDTLQQLSKDLYSFEEFEHEEVSPQEQQPKRESNPVTPAPIPKPDLVPPPLFPMSEELLAEDWEEFALHDFSDEDLPFSSWEKVAIDELSVNNFDDVANEEEETALPAPEPVESALVADEEPENEVEDTGEIDAISPRGDDNLSNREQNEGQNENITGVE
ncbi:MULTISPECIES: hypothetical protein [unclassified Coleofasciculus]|uniref:hypothetical protein n=1 Tax=unclassified Coleofasciculus TaxID=2692782 RepID=UPI00187ED135|nr:MULTISPECIES: hypothetical protein [unclassified Coleofasciculus]MBE9125630.1 hypothetical protein [Coleofasciculus sp. LEGE 07081]MBE9148784.1 hypothetical protein [Coleofasciculus sp. LEGE 07092]